MSPISLKKVATGSSLKATAWVLKCMGILKQVRLRIPESK